MSASELVESREVTKGRNPSAELSYVVSGTTSEATALTAVENAAGTLFQGLVRQSVSVAPIGDPTKTQAWRGTANFGSPNITPTPETGESTFSFDTGGGSRNLKTGVAATVSYPTGAGNAPDHKGLIDVQDGVAQGVDVTVPVYNFSETHFISDANVTTNRGNYYSLTGKVNSASFKGLNAGECLFLGASGTVRGTGEDWEITFRFAASPNRTGLTIAGLSGISVDGWQYVWVETVQEEQTIDGVTKLVEVGKYVHVETLYDSGNFSGLGL